MDRLREAAQRQVRADNIITELNERIFNARRERKAAEDDMAVILQNPEYAANTDIQIGDTRIKIYRPQQWKHGWSITQTALRAYLQVYFARDPNPTATACMQYIMDQIAETSLARTFKFETRR